MPKVVKTKDGWLAGAAGRASEVTLFLAWAENRNVEEEEDLTDLAGILVSPEGEVFHVEENLIPYKITAPFHALGVGMDLALGAFAMGATAEEAVEITIKYHSHCGGKIQKVRL